MIYLLLLLSPFSDQHILPLEILSFQNEERFPGREYLLEQVSAMDTDGTLIYLASSSDPHIVAIDDKGDVKLVFGRKGAGPGEFPYGVSTISVDQETVWAVDQGWKTLYKFQHGEFIDSVPLKLKPKTWFSSTENVFATDGKQVVLPGAPPGKIGQIVKLKESPTVFGQALPQNEFLPGINDTLWAFQNGQWYGLFKHTPLLMIYDYSFSEVAGLQLSSDLIHAYQEEVGGELHKNFTHFPALFTDMQFYKDHLYVMTLSIRRDSNTTLYKINPKDGAILKSFKFQGTQTDFPDVPEPRILSPFNFVILDSGKLILSHSLFWDNGDLWVTHLPGGTDTGP